jgi:hypothetical protein
MQIISFIEDREVTKTLLKYRRLWLSNQDPLPRLITALNDSKYFYS